MKSDEAIKKACVCAVFVCWWQWRSETLSTPQPAVAFFYIQLNFSLKE